ncbi:MAG TPA: hypothetical protein VKA21_08905 [Candidatus Binatia bacterium]|nr:hypothetical protein [Candidatus Binatia bacterium]
MPADALATLTAIARSAGLPDPIVVDGPAGGYRHRARLAIRGRSASPKIGIFQEGSHRIVDIPRCPVHHALVNEVAAAVRDAVRRSGVSLYGDGSRRGLLRYLQVVVERASGSAQVVLVANDTTPASLASTATLLTEALGSRLHSLWWNGNTEPGNAILGTAWHRWSGPEAVVEAIGGARVFYPPAAFGQANLPLADRLVDTVHGWVGDDARVLELHAGVGAIGLGLVRRSRQVAFNEISQEGRAGLALGIAALPAADRERTRVLAGPAADHVGAIDDADVVVCDPPRRGLEPALLAHLARHPPARLVLVSCDLDAFVAESRALTGAGATRLRALTAFVLFPFTAHVETLALFERAGEEDGGEAARGRRSPPAV